MSLTYMSVLSSNERQDYIEYIEELRAKLEDFEKNEEYVRELQDKIKELEEERDAYIWHVDNVCAAKLKESSELYSCLVEARNEVDPDIGLRKIITCCERIFGFRNIL